MHVNLYVIKMVCFYFSKDTMVLLNYYSANNDETYWENPKEFNPQRFLDESGNFKQINAAMPFGAGNIIFSHLKNL